MALLRSKCNSVEPEEGDAKGNGGDVGAGQSDSSDDPPVQKGRIWGRAGVIEDSSDEESCERWGQQALAAASSSTVASSSKSAAPLTVAGIDARKRRRSAR
eukprot:188314-Pleurochrysis_carterae.AAC.1